ncbi:MAG: hypothetical protein ACI8RD_004718 [Bacillariaceae sp.]|jgi:hypothetical protein
MYSLIQFSSSSIFRILLKKKPRCFVPRALLYNDGGFDVSPDGKTLCACAEYWLPEGIDNATELLHPKRQRRDNDDDDDDVDNSDDDYSDDDDRKNDNEMDVDDDDRKKKKHTDKDDFSPTEEKCEEELDGATTTMVPENEKFDAGNESSTANNNSNNHASPTQQQHLSSSPPPQQLLPSKTPPRATSTSSLGHRQRNNQQQQISSPPPTSSLPMTSLGLTPQTPPSNVNPLNYPLSPPSPPGRRFAGGLGSNNSIRSTQQHSHEQLLQQYRRQEQVIRQYDPRYNINQHEQQQQQQEEDHSTQQRIIPNPQQHQRTVTSSSASSTNNRSSENAAVVIPAPPGINHHNPQQQQHQNQRNTGNPFATPSRNPRLGDTNNYVQRGRFVPHVVTISLDTEPYVETTTEQVVIGSVGGGDANYNQAITTQQQLQQQQHQYGSNSRIRTTTVAATKAGDASTATTTVTRTTYNVPGRGAALGATRPHIRERRPRLGQLLSACPLDGTKASAVTCVKFSPCTEFCLIGYGVREPHVEPPTPPTPGESGDGTINVLPQHPPYHPVTAMYQVNMGGKMKHVSTMLSGDDDVNIARFHPDSGYGFVYGTKQGRIRVLGPRPWNYYNC